MPASSSGGFIRVDSELIELESGRYVLVSPESVRQVPPEGLSMPLTYPS